MELVVTVVISGWFPWTTITVLYLSRCRSPRSTSASLVPQKGVLSAFWEHFQHNSPRLNVFPKILQEFEKDPLYGKYLSDCFRNLYNLMSLTYAVPQRCSGERDVLKILRKKYELSTIVWLQLSFAETFFGTNFSPWIFMKIL